MQKMRNGCRIVSRSVAVASYASKTSSASHKRTLLRIFLPSIRWDAFEAPRLWGATGLRRHGSEAPRAWGAMSTRRHGMRRDGFEPSWVGYAKVMRCHGYKAPRAWGATGMRGHGYEAWRVWAAMRRLRYGYETSRVWGAKGIRVTVMSRDGNEVPGYGRHHGCETRLVGATVMMGQWYEPPWVWGVCIVPGEQFHAHQLYISHQCRAAGATKPRRYTCTSASFTLSSSDPTVKNFWNHIASTSEGPNLARCDIVSLRKENYIYIRIGSYVCCTYIHR